MNGEDDDATVFERAGQLWSKGQRIYLSGGSDAHDAWNDDTGAARAYVHVPGGVSTEGFVTNLKAGRAYVTRGPLIVPEVMFGSDLRIAPGQERTLGFELTAANGLARATLVGPDGEIASESFDGEPMTAATEFAVTGEAETAGADWWRSRLRMRRARSRTRTRSGSAHLPKRTFCRRSDDQLITRAAARRSGAESLFG